MRKKRLLFCLILLCLSTALFSQASKIQSLFMYNFIKEIEWPNQTSNVLKIGVLGSKNLYSEMQSLLNGKTSGNKKIEIVWIESLNSMPNLEVIFVERSKSEEIHDLVQNQKQILIITDKPGMIEKGAGINFIVMEGKQTFEINKRNIERHGLIVSSSLLRLGIQK